MLNPITKNNYRNERKFRVSAISYPELLNLVKFSPFLFREIYCQRTVNNIYMDSFNLGSYFDNVDGFSNRTKFRIRWYGSYSIEVNSPLLEFKIKRGHVGTKRCFPLTPFIFQKGFSRENLIEVFDKSTLPDEVHEILRYLRLSLYNKYQRQYFISACKLFRITIDKNMHYYGLNDHSNHFMANRSDHNISVLEIKYNPKDDLLATKLIEQFSFRMTKNSKYVSGASYFLHSS
jgi:hypothetical protein